VAVQSKWQIDEQLFNILKPHQKEGVRFMWKTVVIGYLSKVGNAPIIPRFKT